eukprot:Sdes_comp20950_c0_seq1m18581
MQIGGQFLSRDFSINNGRKDNASISRIQTLLILLSCLLASLLKFLTITFLEVSTKIAPLFSPLKNLQTAIISCFQPSEVTMISSQRSEIFLACLLKALLVPLRAGKDYQVGPRCPKIRGFLFSTHRIVSKMYVLSISCVRLHFVFQISASTQQAGKQQ